MSARSYDAAARKCVFLSFFWGQGHGIILVEDLFLGLALVDVELIHGIQLPVQSRAFGQAAAWRKRPVVSKAFHQVVFEMPFESPKRGPATALRLADALRSFADHGDPSLNLREHWLVREDLDSVGIQFPSRTGLSGEPG